MTNLNTQIIAYLTVNNIAYSSSDYSTGIPSDGIDQILSWDTAKLGAQPTQAQLDAATIIYEGEKIAIQNKSNATTLLQQTDWTCTVDITNPQYSNPYLMNQDAFLTYRSQLRAIAINPPTTPATFPNKPEEQWS
jgi:hypothetical protein